MKSRSLDGDSPSTPVSFSIRDDRAAASESLQYLLGLANAGADQCVEGPVLKVSRTWPPCPFRMSCQTVCISTG